MNKPDEQLIYDRTQLDIDNDTKKGQYNSSDLNRVEKWCEYLAEQLTLYGYPISITTKTNWVQSDMRYGIGLERIRGNIEAIMNGFHYYTQIEPNAEFLNFIKANNWEKILAETYEQLFGMRNYYVYSGVANLGQPRVYQNRFRHFMNYNGSLESTGTQWIDTGILSQVGIKMEMMMEFTDEPTVSMTPFGSHYNSPNLNFQRTTSSHWYTVFDGTQTTNTSVFVKTYMTYKLELFMGESEQYFKANGETIYSAENSVTGVSSKNLYLFSRNASYPYPASMRLYYCKIWLGDELVRDFVPSNNNGACLYDKVSGGYFANQGTGDFIYN